MTASRKTYKTQAERQIELGTNMSIVTGRAGKMLSIAFLAASTVPVAVPIATYLASSFIAATMRAEREQDQSQAPISDFEKSVFGCSVKNLAKAFIEELKPLKGFREAIQQRSIKQLAL